MNRNITERLQSLRGFMQDKQLDAVYISGTDPHMSEYLCAHWQTRKFMSGFTGSYGELVITREKAGLWTDSRYFIQAEDELRGSGINMYKLRVPDAVPVVSWLTLNLQAGARLGVDPLSLPLATYRNFTQELEPAGIRVEFCSGMLDGVWHDRPPLPRKPVYALPDSITGETRQSKLDRIASALAEKGAELTIITALDDLAWTFNLRGNDVDYNPVFLGFGIVGSAAKALFVSLPALPEDIRNSLETGEIEVLDYDDFFPYLEKLTGNILYLDPSSVNTAVWDAIRKNNGIVEGTSLPTLLKAVKNKTELEGFRKAMRKDGVAMVQFLHWVKNNSGKAGLTEYTAAVKLKEFRSLQSGFRGESFSPIVGYLGHGAIVHFSVDEKIACEIKPRGILLFDSGGQFDTGTTDITRTIALGPVTAQQKRDYTLVMKGMISLSMAVFPAGTKGIQLDVMARQALWSEGLNYGHGTGHGVGHCLNVHEGPASIRQDFNAHNIVPGMVFSNEPGLYRKDEYGIRTENLIVCVEKTENEFGTFYGFDTLTLCPLDTSLLMKNLLTAAERQWLNDYHRTVREELMPLVPEELKAFLLEITAPV